eukprot:m.249771 g.249771  ORF g.249771 m.249771 type:complete len:85 (-) comp16141_c0_seq17:4098-4352(-)
MEECRRVLILNTGGTIGMSDFGNGYEPVAGFLEQHIRKMQMFHDEEYANSQDLGPGLVTGVSKFGKRIYYESEYVNQLLLQRYW